MLRTPNLGPGPTKLFLTVKNYMRYKLHVRSRRSYIMCFVGHEKTRSGDPSHVPCIFIAPLLRLLVCIQLNNDVSSKNNTSMQLLVHGYPDITTFEKWSMPTTNGET